MKQEGLIITNKTRSRIDIAWLSLKASLIMKQLKIKQQVSLVFVSLQEIERLNRMYRGRLEVTDVLSFKYDDGQLLGEIIICPAKAKQQAKFKSLPSSMELLTLFTHGLLHLLNFKHETKNQSEKMIAMERKLLAINK